MIKEALLWVLFAVLGVGLITQWLQLQGLTKSLKKSNKLIEKRLNSFDEKLGRAETKIDFSGKLLNRLRGEIPDDIRQDLNETMAQVKALGTAQISHKAKGGGKATRLKQAVNPSSSDSKSPAHLPNQGSASKTFQPSKPSTSSNLIAWKFSDWRLQAKLTDDDFFTYELNQLFDVVLVEGSKGAGAATYLRVWELDSKGDRITPALKINSFQFVRSKQALSRFSAFNPKLEISLIGALSISDVSFKAIPEVSLSAMSYGQTSDDLIWRFIRVGVFYEADNPGISFSPASYNLGKQLPLVSNVWLSPLYFWNGQHGLGLAVGGAL